MSVSICSLLKRFFCFFVCTFFLLSGANIIEASLPSVDEGGLRGVGEPYFESLSFLVWSGPVEGSGDEWEDDDRHGGGDDWSGFPILIASPSIEKGSGDEWEDDDRHGGGDDWSDFPILIASPSIEKGSGDEWEDDDRHGGGDDWSDFPILIASPSIEKGSGDEWEDDDLYDDGRSLSLRIDEPGLLLVEQLADPLASGLSAVDTLTLSRVSPGVYSLYLPRAGDGRRVMARFVPLSR